MPVRPSVRALDRRQHPLVAVTLELVQAVPMLAHAWRLNRNLSTSPPMLVQHDDRTSNLLTQPWVAARPTRAWLSRLTGRKTRSRVSMAASAVTQSAARAEG